jgi:nitrite reductase/ring-hydroxylating ferredoxin subunit
MSARERDIRHIRQGKLFGSIADFDLKNATTRGEFVLDMPYLKKDVEWNHMDQLHRPYIHHTYSDNLRIALGRDFAVSLTRWGKWPFLITVTDMRIEEGLYYQDLVLAGVVFIHNTISMTEIEDNGSGNTLRLKLEWIIHSHRFLKPLHAILGRMFYKLNVRLQEEDAEIRGRRYALRQDGYSFLSDPPDYYNSNRLTNNTVYPDLPSDIFINLEKFPLGTLETRKAGTVEFLVRRDNDAVHIWPAACPHEGGSLGKGKLLENCRLECPWHGLKFSAATLTVQQPEAEAYGFSYRLDSNTVRIRQLNKQTLAA